MVDLLVNGKPMAFSNGETPLTIECLLQRIGVVPAHVVVEVDGNIVSRQEFDKFILTTGMNIELIQFVGGG